MVKRSSQKPDPSIGDLVSILNERFNKVDERFEQIENQLKVMDVKIASSEKSTRFEIKTEIYSAEKRLEETLQAQILVSAKELHKRITTVGDQIVIGFDPTVKKVKDHEKRIKKLEEN